MKNKLSTILLLVITLLSHSLTAQTTTDYEKAIEEVVKSYTDYHMFRGAVLVAKNGKIVFNKALGKANIEWGIENTPDTKFVVGSISKSFTATLAMKLIQEKKMKLDDKIAQYLPEYALKKANKTTIHHLISNTSGIPNYFRLPGWSSGRFNRLLSTKEFVQEFAKLDLAFEPGSGYMYSNAGYFLLGLIIEKVTSMSYAKALKTYIFDPLQMSNSGVFTNNIVVKKRAYGYRFAAEGGYRNQSFINMDLFTATGNLYSTVNDLFKFDQALYTDKLLNKAHREKLFNPKYQNGWTSDVLELNGLKAKVPIVGYNGQIKGYSSIITRFVKDKHSIIILGNIGTSFIGKYRLTTDIAAVLYGAPVTPKQTPMAFMLTKALYEGKLKNAIAYCLAHKTQYSTDERLINSIAQQLAWSGSRRQATHVFKLNATIFSKSFRANLQLAKIYKQQNRVKEAVPYYKKALKLKPDNQYIKKLLDTLDK